MTNSTYESIVNGGEKIAKLQIMIETKSVRLTVNRNGNNLVYKNRLGMSGLLDVMRGWAQWSIHTLSIIGYDSANDNAEFFGSNPDLTRSDHV